MNVKQGIIVNIKTMNYMPAKKVSIYPMPLWSRSRFFVSLESVMTCPFLSKTIRWMSGHVLFMAVSAVC